jgi:hypothetical protein
MAHLNDQNNQLLILDLINDAIVTHPNTIQFLLTLQLDAINRARFFSEII